MDNIIVTTIDSLGSVEVLNDLAQFTITAKSKNDSLASAVATTESKVDHITKSLETLKEKGMKVDGDFVVSYANFKLEHRENNEKIHAGFQSTATVSWCVTVDDRIDEFYKACLLLDSNMSKPIFSIKEKERFTSEALQMAAANVKEKLERECSLLGVPSTDLKIHNWNFGYEGHLAALNTSAGLSNHRSYGYGGVTGATGPMGAQGSPGIMGPGGFTHQISKVGSIYQEPLDYKITPGSETFRIAVRVNYVWNK